MAGKEQTRWQALAASKWPDWKIDGDGHLAVTDSFQECVYLHTLPLAAQACLNDAPWRRKFYKLELLKPCGAFKLPGSWERDDWDKRN